MKLVLVMPSGLKGYKQSNYVMLCYFKKVQTTFYLFLLMLWSFILVMIILKATNNFLFIFDTNDLGNEV